jgi:hypothetical protein
VKREQAIRAARFAGIVLALAVGLLIAARMYMLGMPGDSHRGPLPELSAAESKLSAELRRDVEKLGREIGERNVAHPEELRAAARFIEASLAAAGHEPRRQIYDVAGQSCENLEVELAGDREIVVVGAHYDSVLGAPGANDNGTGVAAMLALARLFAGKQHRRTLRFVAFANEEPPHFQTADMGSVRYARRSRQRAERLLLRCRGQPGLPAADRLVLSVDRELPRLRVERVVTRAPAPRGRQLP